MVRIFTLLFLLVFCSVGSAATFTSIATGSYSALGTWSQAGGDADGIPDLDDDVVITGGFTVTLVTSSHCRNLTIDAGSTLNISVYTMLNWGNCTQNGSVLGTGAWQFRAAGTYTGSGLNLSGSIYFYFSYTIAPGSTIIKNSGAIIIAQGCVVTNNGTVQLNSAANGYIQFLNTQSKWVNAANSELGVSKDFNGGGILTASASPNTVRYKGSSAVTILGTTYHNLILQGSAAHTKSLAGAISVNNNFTIGVNVTFNMASFSMFLGGNWTNNANTNSTNMGQVVFSGAGTQTITRATGNTERFGSVVVAGAGTVTLADSITVAGTLTISSGTLDVSASNYSIRVRSTFSDNATFNARQGTVFMTGTVAQTIDGVANTNFYNLTCTNAAGVTIPNFAKQIQNILSVQAGAFGTSGSGTLTLLASGPTTAARIGPLGATASLVGTGWIIQTYIDGPATAYWQYLGSPVSGSTINDWDGDTRFYMSAVGGNDGTACCPTFFSVRTYNEPSNTYSNVTSTGTALTPGRGFMIWMADDETSLTAPLIFDTRGTPNFNTVNRAVTAGGSGGGYNLVSNPMASPINYATVVSASSASLSGNFVILTESGSYVTNPNGGTIAAAQGFMCVASTAGNITFDETCKSTTANPDVIRQLAGNEVRIKVGNEVNGLGEEAVVKLNPDGDESLNLSVDLPYLPSPYDNATHIYTNNSFGEQFLLNNLGTGSDHLMIPVSVTTSTPGIQTMTFKGLNTVTEYNCAWLEDLTSGAKINLNQSDIYSFDESEMGLTRNFILHFERTNDCTFDLQNSVATLDAQTNVFVSGEQIFAHFEFETEEVVTISMFDLGGRMVMGETTMNVSNQTVTLANPDAHGIYLVRIQKGNEVTTKKIYY